ncbi:hypothetical protein [Desulfitobacterium chlororespirans]|uniref:Uncharacterized protein n=1 Tax=Desulfitobacterium chlororespirans DSM 11544 TaxID=1121395 RepID=A0A1M7ULT3_9FIRM|nr:hypothetical protein [Desulfitobacterium chlororespirans]SHN83908.1 hypothetical protein SAMN02745215_04101 [Desulfitobacterium chlororespirans DSM 11544]
MVIGFGFGSPLQSLLMLLLTSLLSYVIFKNLRRRRHTNLDPYEERERRRQYYYEQRQRARDYAREFDLSDEEIERRLDEELDEYRHR